MTEKSITWKELTQIEPRLNRLYKEIKAIKDDGKLSAFCANWRWYGYGKYAPGFKSKMHCLVGFEAASGNPRIHTMQAYDLATEKLYSALPDCRNCCCL